MRQGVAIARFLFAFTGRQSVRRLRLLRPRIGVSVKLSDLSTHTHLHTSIRYDDSQTATYGIATLEVRIRDIFLICQKVKRGRSSSWGLANVSIYPYRPAVPSPPPMFQSNSQYAPAPISPYRKMSTSPARPAIDSWPAAIPHSHPHLRPTQGSLLSASRSLADAQRTRGGGSLAQ